MITDMKRGAVKRSAILISFIFLVALLSGCNEPIPSSDLQDAKQAIAVAEVAKAAKYDPDNLQAARDRYSKALKMVVEDENGAARKFAIEAKQKADLATLNSRRKLALDTIREAQELLLKAENQRAAFLARTYFQQARTKLDDARKGVAEKKYVQAYTDAENAKEAAGKSIDEANKKMATLNKAHGDADLALKRAQSSEVVKKYASKEFGELQGNYLKGEEDRKKVVDPTTITAGNKEMRNNLAKDAYDRSLKTARDTVDAVSNVFRLAIQREREAYKKMANSKLEEARRLLKEIEKLKQQGLIKRLAAPQPKPDMSGTTVKTATNDAANMSDTERYDAAVKALKRAESTFTNENYQTSIKNSEEAIRLAKLIKELAQKIKTWYIVKYNPAARDCLWRIAAHKNHYGDAALWPKIWKANKHLIVDPDLIYPGQKFAIPPK